MTGPALEVRDLVKRYGARTAVDSVSFTVERGSLLALLGPNGAGKTSIIEVCEGYRAVEGGSVEVLGHDPSDPAVRCRVGVMLQDGVGGYSGARTGELLDLFASYATHPHSPTALLQLVGLDDVAGTPVKRLSGGQQQRLSLALALVGRPELVFLDEPTAGMDPQARRTTWDVVAQLTADGVTVVLTTHYLDEAQRLADQVIVLDAGRIVAQGTPGELLSGAAAGLRFTTEPALDAAALSADLPAAARVVESEPGSYVVATAPDPALIAAIAAWCARNRILLTGLSSGTQSLEDVYLELTGHRVRT